MKKLWKTMLGVAAGAVVILLGYSVYVFAAYDRLEDRLPLTVENARQAEAETEKVYTAVSYNLGFGAYSAGYSFFMDGGTESRAYSAEAVRENIGGAMDAVSNLKPDFLLLQEVDQDATRSYHVDEVSMAAELMPEKTWVYAQKYDSPFLFWPVTDPQGASRSGIVTMSAYCVDSALRRSLPVAENISCILDLDRCYSVSRIPVENGKTLCLYNAHLSAYNSDSQIAMKQLELLLVFFVIHQRQVRENTLGLQPRQLIDAVQLVYVADAQAVKSAVDLQMDLCGASRRLCGLGEGEGLLVIDHCLGDVVFYDYSGKPLRRMP